MEYTLKTIEFLAYFTCMGACILRLILVKQKLQTIITINDRWSKIFWSGLIILVLSSIALFFIRTKIMSGANFVGTFVYIIPVLQNTHYGNIFILKLIFLLLVGICLLINRKNLNLKIDIIMFILIMGIGYTFSAVSHAANNGSFSIPAIIDWIHFLSTSIWGGNILITLLVFYRNIPIELLEQKGMITCLVGKLSAICAYALLFVLITGFYKMQVVLSNGLPLCGTNYGQLLSFKLIFVILLVGLGAANRYLLLPSIAKWAKQSSDISYNPIQFFSYVLATQSFILCVILAITSTLINHAPTL